MIFTQTSLEGVWLVALERRGDERGYFARAYCADEFSKHGLPTSYPQCNLSFNARSNTLRGLHYQADPHPEGKLVRCARGAIFDVAVDLRVNSPTYLKWTGCELSAENGWAMFIGAGFAHGFQTLEDNSEVFYQMTKTFQPGFERGYRWDDPTLGIEWPLRSPTVSDRDATLPLISR